MILSIEMGVKWQEFGDLWEDQSMCFSEVNLNKELNKWAMSEEPQTLELEGPDIILSTQWAFKGYVYLYSGIT